MWDFHRYTLFSKGFTNCKNLPLTNYSPALLIYTPWKHQKPTSNTGLSWVKYIKASWISDTQVKFIPLSYRIWEECFHKIIVINSYWRNSGSHFLKHIFWYYLEVYHLSVSVAGCLMFYKKQIIFFINVYLAMILNLAPNKFSL